jgi:hypothetical protein
MTHYWFCFLDETGHVRHVLDLDCEGDEAALKEQKRINELTELWCGGRRVRTFVPERRRA